MTFPNKPDKYDDTPMLTSANWLAHQRKAGRIPESERPDGCVLCYQPAALKHASEQFRGRRVHGFYGEVYILESTRGRVALAGNFGIGAPVVAMLLEQFAALGVRRCIAVGIAGALQPLACGEIVVAERAIRDEGTSHHYVLPARYAEASPGLTQRLRAALDGQGLAHHAGATWTTDAPFRETLGEVRQYREEGVLTVEMEAAALFSVGACLGMETASAFAVADSLAGETWQMPPDRKPMEQALRHLVSAAVEAVSA